MTGGKEERINLEIKLISSPAPIIVRKETFASPLFNGKEGNIHMKSMTSELPLPLPWRDLNQVFVWKRRERFS